MKNKIFLIIMATASFSFSCMAQPEGITKVQWQNKQNELLTYYLIATNGKIASYYFNGQAISLNRPQPLDPDQIRERRINYGKSALELAQSLLASDPHMTVTPILNQQQYARWPMPGEINDPAIAPEVNALKNSSVQTLSDKIQEVLQKL